MNLLQMISQQGLVAWTVLVGLLVLSLLVWAAIVIKTLSLRRSDRAYDALQRAVTQRRAFPDVRAWCWDQDNNLFARIVLAGASEMEAIGGAPSPETHVWDSQRASLSRAMGQAMRREEIRTSRGMPVLATAGNVSPFIGLLGTVWGIMRSFHEIGAQGAASLAVVAPGISEALLATAAGLFAAIPAVIAFNYFRSRINEQRARMQDVADEVINLLEHERLGDLMSGRMERPSFRSSGAAAREDA
jgi:biopolymer transport protein TolQ